MKKILQRGREKGQEGKGKKCQVGKNDKWKDRLSEGRQRKISKKFERRGDG